MEYSISTNKIFDYVTKAGKLNKKVFNALTNNPTWRANKEWLWVTARYKAQEYDDLSWPRLHFQIEPHTLGLCCWKQNPHKKKASTVKAQLKPTKLSNMSLHMSSSIQKDAQMNPLMRLKWRQISMKHFAFTTAKKSDMSSTLLENTGQPQKKSTKDFWIRLPLNLKARQRASCEAWPMLNNWNIYFPCKNGQTTFPTNLSI